MIGSLDFSWLTAIIIFPLVASVAVPFIPDKDGKTIRWYGLEIGLLEFAFMIYAFWHSYDFQNSSFQLIEKYPWAPQIVLNLTLAVDGLSMPLLILTGLINTLAIFATWRVTTKPRLFYGLILLMYSAQLGVFMAQDLLFFFLMWEIQLVPMYLIISIWGGPKRHYTATKFILYTANASIFIL